MGSCFGVIRQRSHLSSRSASRYSTKGGGRNEPLKKDKPKWKSEYPMTEGQLRSKRDEFWDTAPAFDGRKEIWDALKAAAVATECNDHELAQAIVDGASITLPHGSLMECYDELGNRYQLPAYCLAPPVNLVSECNDRNVSENSELQEKKEKEFQLKVRLSTGKDLRLSVTMADSIRQLKKQLQIQEDIDTTHQRWFFSGKLLTDKTRLQDTKIQKDFVIQVIVSQPIVPN
ncbi:ubiquitin domain-containing protein 1a isoform X1 [Puntigrus tetrazona]|uniref:ubiquitin domain-containing protein 1a isoform X1 n=1 Tax=Puntigrus tetrazona TaxID=1606681 RepID=UPI001C8A1587|nr:ubiquitin domain-containing protein 1a isoform X1 [Puntigrus tetrazona]XP_043111281.1 ubiquitin domain-containing protein 1a isoform X1 [Puntigrus tetrazona]